MNITGILSPDRIVCDVDAISKKRSLEILSETLARSETGIASSKVFDSLLNREKLGSTGLGHGVALPHGRSDLFTEARLAVIKLIQGIDYDAPDSEPVDLLFALIVPEDSCDEHLQILALLAEMLADENLLTQLRQSSTCESFYECLTHWEPSSHAA